MSAPDVVVLDGAQRTALACTRSLGRRNLTVAVADHQARPLAAASRYCRKLIQCPDPRIEPEGYVSWIANLGEQWPGVVVMPVTDLSVPLCIAARDRGASIRTALPSALSYDALTDKFNLATLAARESLLAPRTLAVRRAGLAALAMEAFQFPVVLKPRWSAMATSGGVLRRTVSYANNASELQSMLTDSLVGDEDEFLVQEFVAGYGFGIFALFDHGRPLQFFAHRRIREKPPSGGVSVLSRSEPLDQALALRVSKLLESQSWHGVAMMEFKRDVHGTAWLIEVNARLWGSVQLSIDSGVDFPVMLHQLSLGASPSTEDCYATGRQLRWLLGDLDSLYLTLRSQSVPARKKLADLLRFCVPWAPGMRYELLRPTDPVPAFAALRDYVIQVATRQ